ncbi:hypothetical protein J6590_008487 [Homalodisca vitripennis]|nr:hypothetical protein J6590_008487 [Homalodisca vitripennis]
MVIPEIQLCRAEQHTLETMVFRDVRCLSVITRVGYTQFSTLRHQSSRHDSDFSPKLLQNCDPGDPVV